MADIEHGRDPFPPRGRVDGHVSPAARFAGGQDPVAQRLGPHRRTLVVEDRRWVETP